ncbi:hypothetical protein [Clostridium ihumii]|uniref:hypothetical protein n=1 Tax=Clostridium ihumii TaxID=1470356 RepID=UPI00058B5ADD|nr:hypothetical protein [Clostridium ihumii]
MKNTMIEIIEVLLISVCVCLLWRVLEKLILGQVNPNSVDSIIGLILIVSLYGNLKHCKNIIKDNKDSKGILIRKIHLWISIIIDIFTCIVFVMFINAALSTLGVTKSSWIINLVFICLSLEYLDNRTDEIEWNIYELKKIRKVS